MFRRYNRKHSRFDQPDPYNGAYNMSDPQSFNRYAYVQGDPVNLIDPSGLMPCEPGNYSAECDSSGFGGFGGGFNMNDRHSNLNPTGREIIMGNFGWDVRYIVRFHSFQWTDSDGDEHISYWWERLPQGYTSFGGNRFIQVKVGHGPAPQPQPLPPNRLRRTEAQTKLDYHRCVKQADQVYQEMEDRVYQEMKDNLFHPITVGGVGASAVQGDHFSIALAVFFITAWEMGESQGNESNYNHALADCQRILE